MLASLENWALKDAVISTRGAKSCPLENTKCPGCSVTLNIGTADSPLTSPFGATSFGDENTQRKTLELSLESNQLTRVPSLKNMGKLSALLLGSNRITRIEKGSVSPASVQAR